MAKAKPRTRKISNTREQILHVAEELIARHGMEGFQLKDVAERVGIRPPSIFAHFKGRDALAQAVSERFSGGLAARVKLEDGEDPEDTVRRWVREIVQYYVENPAQIRLTLRDLGMVGSPDIFHFESTNSMMREIVGVIEDVLERGVKQGKFRRIRTKVFMAQTIGGIVANLAWNGWAEDGRVLLDGPMSRYQDEAEEMVLGFLAPRKKRDALPKSPDA